MANRDTREIEPIFRSSAELRDRIVRSVGNFTLALFGLSGLQPETSKFAGTGTWISSGGKQFILTAFHVWEEVLKRSDRIGITLREGVNHRSVIETAAVHAVGLPKPDEWAEWGPDLVLLSVPPESVREINLYRAFWNAQGHHSLGREVFEISVLMGAPEAYGSFAPMHTRLMILGMFLGLETRCQRDGLDYLDYEFDLSLAGMPRAFGGVSGGGAWRIWLYWFEETGEIDWAMSLHGVAFYEFPIIEERRTVRCHGPDSIRASLAAEIAARK